jgi:hypothetical protein
MTLVQKRLATLGILVAVALSGAAMVVWQQDRTKIEELEARKANLILDMQSPTRVKELKLRRGEETITMKRMAETGELAWQIASPIPALADGQTVDAMLQHLADLESVQEVGEKAEDGSVIAPKDRNIFGLEPSRLSIEMTIEGKPATLLMGKKSSFDGNIYVGVAGSPAVWTVDGALEYQLDKNLFQWREKRLALFEGDKATKISVNLGGHLAYSLEKRDDDWWITHPAEFLAEASQINGIIAAMGSLRAKEFVVETGVAHHASDFGLENPAAGVSLEFAEGENPVEFHLGFIGEGADEAYFATLAAPSPIIRLPDNQALRKLAVKLDVLRDKRVSKFDREEVHQIRLVSGDVSMRFAKSRDAKLERDTWAMTSPETFRAQDSRLVGILYKLWAMKAKVIQVEEASDADRREYQLDKPSLSIELLDKGGAAIVSFAFGKVNGDAQFVSASNSKRIDMIESSLAEEISTKPQDYKEDESEG